MILEAKIDTSHLTALTVFGDLHPEKYRQCLYLDHFGRRCLPTKEFLLALLQEIDPFNEMNGHYRVTCEELAKIRDYAST